jgi:carbonic anhydrase/acetyltransferase-like protein (isoleucine patch superfamily)
VEEWAVIGDGAVVPPKQTLALGRVFVGNPARDVRGVSDEEKEFSMRAVVAYADLCARCSAGLQKLSL